MEGFLVVTSISRFGFDDRQTGFLKIFSRFRKFKVALNPMYRIFFKTALPKVTSHPAYQNSIIRKIFTVRFLKYKRLKLKLRVFLAGHSVAMVTYCVPKIILTCSPMIG